MAHWIKGAVAHKGAFKAAAERAGESTAAFAKEHEGDSGTLGHRARLAETLIKMHPKAASRYAPKTVSRG